MDRELYSVLAMDLCHDPVVSVQILALWLWLERLGFKNVVKRLLTLPRTLINQFADEAVTCLSYINETEVPDSTETTDIPLTSVLLKRKISVQLLLENRDTVLAGVRKIAEVCTRVLADLMEEAIKKHADVQLLHSMTLPPAVDGSFLHSFANFGLGGSSSSTRGSSLSRSTAQGGRRISSSGDHAGTASSIVNVCPLPSGQVLIRRFANLEATTHRSIPRTPIPKEDRSMFITFSKGYPVTQAELTGFFTTAFGDCIESFQMQTVRPGEQSLYARVVFRVPFVIDMVLNGLPKAKFTINGKHLWMRKFIPKTRATSTAGASSLGASSSSSSSEPPTPESE